MGMRMVVQIRALLGVVELVVVVILTELIIWRYRRRDRILLRIPANSVHDWVIWVMNVSHAPLPFRRQNV